jgi:hypothetical protein
VHLSEFRARITYLAFAKKMGTAGDAEKYMRKMIDELQHLSVVAASQAALAVYGLTLPQAEHAAALVRKYASATVVRADAGTYCFEPCAFVGCWMTLCMWPSAQTTL